MAIVLWGCAPGPVPHAPPPTAAVVSVPAPAPAPPPAPTCATASLHWRASDPLPFSPGRYAIEEDGTLWILDGDDRLHRSRDRGATFDDQPMQLPDTMEEEEAFVRDLAARQGVVFIAAIDAVYRSEDGGATLERAWAGPLNIGGHMTYSPLESLWTDGDALYVLENQGEVQRSRDGGLRWSHVPGPGETSRYAFHEMTGNRDGFRYITAGPDELLVSTDGDMTWSMKPMPLSQHGR